MSDLSFLFLNQVRMRGPKAVIHEFGGNRMIICLARVCDHPHLFIHQPLRAGLVDTRTVGEVLVRVCPLVLVSSVNDYDIAFLDLWR